MIKAVCVFEKSNPQSMRNALRRCFEKKNNYRLSLSSESESLPMKSRTSCSVTVFGSSCIGAQSESCTFFSAGATSSPSSSSLELLSSSIEMTFGATELLVFSSGPSSSSEELESSSEITASATTGFAAGFSSSLSESSSLELDSAPSASFVAPALAASSGDSSSSSSEELESSSDSTGATASGFAAGSSSSSSLELESSSSAAFGSSVFTS